MTAPSSTLSLLAVSGGLVTITAVVENLDGPGRNPSGFILAGFATLNERVTAVPEPGSVGLVVLAALAGWASRRRR